MKIISNYFKPRQKNVYIVELDKPVLPQGLINFYARPAETQKVARCSLLQDILANTPRLYPKDPYPLFSFQMENTDNGRTRLIMQSPYDFNNNQIEIILNTIYQRVKNAFAPNAKPLIDGQGLLDDVRQSKRDDEFKPNEKLANSYPEFYAAQRALYAALTRSASDRPSVLDKIRSDGGDLHLHYDSIGADQDTGEITYSLIAVGACTGCSTSLYTMQEFYKALRDSIAFLAKSGDLAGYSIGRINMYAESDLTTLAYSVGEEGIYNNRNVLTQTFPEPKAAPQPA